MRLSEIDRVREPFGATVNDIVMLVVSGAVRRWHRLRGMEVGELRAMVAVNLRAEGDRTPGNRMGVVAVRLPVGETDAVRRLRMIQKEMGRVKSDRRASFYPYLARIMLVMPASVGQRFGRLQTSRTSFVCSNIPGPHHKCFLAGQPIERIYPYIPLVGDHPMSIAVYSYCGVLCVGIDVDPLALGDARQIREAMQASYEEILRVPPARRARGRVRCASSPALSQSGS
jgi:hypothetical protein